MSIAGCPDQTHVDALCELAVVGANAALWIGL